MHTHARGLRCRKSSRPTLQACLALAGTLSGGGAFAGTGSGILYGPAGAGAGVAAIPSLGGVAMMLLGAFMLFVFWRMHRSGNFPGGRFMAIALVSGAIVNGMGGAKLVSDAIAQAAEIYSHRTLTDPAGDFVSFEPNNPSEGQIGEWACVINGTSIPLMILELHDVSGRNTCPETPPDNTLTAVQACSAGLILEPEERCGAGNTGGNASDLRLKTDIVQVGVAANGLPLYEFRYLDGATRYRGVMAQDVLQHTPAAVRMRADGYMAVDYGMLGLEMQPVR